MSKNKWVRSVSFNHTTPKDVERLKHIGKKSFSRYVKRLIDEDIKRKEETKKEAPVKQESKKEIVYTYHEDEIKKEVSPKTPRQSSSFKNDIQDMVKINGLNIKGVFKPKN